MKQHDLKPRMGFERKRVQKNFPAETMAKQSFQAECDVNTIMARYEKTGLIEHVNQHQGNYGDFTQAPGDYQEALDTVIRAQEMFQTIPAKVRARFENDPGLFLDFVQDPKNVDELVEMGLANAPPAKQKPEAKPEAQSKEAAKPSEAEAPKGEGEPKA